MGVEQDDRVVAIRGKVARERLLVNQLDDTLGDLKQMLRPASDFLDDVEDFFLAPSILREPRSDAALSAWLGAAAQVLSRAIRQREYVESLVAKYGPNAKIIPAM